MAKYYVVTHKDIDSFIKDNFTVMFVGAAKKNSDGTEKQVPSGMLSDAEGDNISEKNGTYCELTAMYQVWKNRLNNSDSVGFCHYRRFFTTKSHSMNVKHYLNSDSIDRVMGDKRIILPKKILYLKTVWGMIEDVPFCKEMNLMRAALSNVSPEYVYVYDAYINGNETYLWNMFVMRQEDFSNYCDWMFTVLSEVERIYHAGNTIDFKEDRLYGFLSERLLNLWVTKNIDSKEIKELRVIHTAEGNFKGWLGSFIRPMKQALRILIYRSKHK